MNFTPAVIETGDQAINTATVNVAGALNTFGEYGHFAGYDDEHNRKKAIEAVVELLQTEEGRTAFVNYCVKSINHWLFVLWAQVLRSFVIRGGTWEPRGESRLKAIKLEPLTKEQLHAIAVAHPKVINIFSDPITKMPTRSSNQKGYSYPESFWDGNEGKHLEQCMHLILEVLDDKSRWNFATGLVQRFIGGPNTAEDRRGTLPRSVYGRLRNLKDKDDNPIPGLFSRHELDRYEKRKKSGAGIPLSKFFNLSGNNGETVAPRPTLADQLSKVQVKGTNGHAPNTENGVTAPPPVPQAQQTASPAPTAVPPPLPPVPPEIKTVGDRQVVVTTDLEEAYQRLGKELEVNMETNSNGKVPVDETGAASAGQFPIPQASSVVKPPPIPGVPAFLQPEAPVPPVPPAGTNVGILERMKEDHEKVESEYRAQYGQEGDGENETTFYQPVWYDIECLRALGVPEIRLSKYKLLGNKANVQPLTESECANLQRFEAEMSELISSSGDI